MIDRSESMSDDIEPLVGSWRDEIAREQFICLFAHFVWVLAVQVPLPKPLFTDRVGNIQDVKFVSDACLSYQGSHPATPFHGVCRKIEYDRKIVPQNVDNVRTHRSAKSCR